MELYVTFYPHHGLFLNLQSRSPWNAQKHHYDLILIDSIVEKTEDKATQKLDDTEKEKLIALLKQIND